MIRFVDMLGKKISSPSLLESQLQKRVRLESYAKRPVVVKKDRKIAFEHQERSDSNFVFEVSAHYFHRRAIYPKMDYL